MKKGFKFHEDIFKTYSGNSKYYYRECREINKALDNYHMFLSCCHNKQSISKICLCVANKVCKKVLIFIQEGLCTALHR